MQAIVHELSAIDKADLALIRRHYSPSRRGRIRNTIWLYGELATAVVDGDLRPRDEEFVTDAYVAALPAVPQSDPSWDSAIDALQAGPVSRRPADWWLATTTIGPADILPAMPPAWTDSVGDTTPDDFDWDSPGEAPDESITRQPGYEASLNAAGITLMPISGGSPEAEDAPPIAEEHFEPTEQDWTDYREWSQMLAVKRWLASNPPFEAWLEANGGVRP